MNTTPALASAIEAFQSGDLDRARQLIETRSGPERRTPLENHLLGLIHCQTGDFARGVACLEQASNSEPGNGAYRAMLARALFDAGRPSEVLALPVPDGMNGSEWAAFWQSRAQSAEILRDWPAAVNAWTLLTKRQSSDWRAHAGLGAAFASLDEWNAAAESFDRAVSLNPADPALRKSFAEVLECGGLGEEALHQLHEAVRLCPSNVETRIAQAQLLRRLGRTNESLAAVEAAPEGEDADSLDLLMERARSLVDLLRLDDAERLYRRILEDQPQNPSAIRELGLLLERGGRIDQLRQLIGGPGAHAAAELGLLRAAVAFRDNNGQEALRLLLTEDPRQDPVRWYRLHAKISDLLADSEGAFASADAMNRSVLQFDQWRQRGLAYRQRVRTLSAIATEDLIAALPQLPPTERRSPAFLVGFPRSGTTLLDTFLMGHSGTAVLEEVHMLGAAERAIGTAADLGDASLEQLISSRAAYFAELDRHVDPGFDGLVIDKLPLNMLGLPLIHAIFPGAPIIFAQRHPCDAVLSGFMQSFVMNDAMACFLDLGDAADLYDATMHMWENSRRVIPARVHALVYEELVADPELALRPLIAFLGLEWQAALLDHRSTAWNRGAIITPSYDQVTQELTRRPSGRWRRYRKQLQAVLPILLPWAQRLGYR